MSLFESVFLPAPRASDPAKPPGPAEDFWYVPVGMGGAVAPLRAMQYSAVYACVRVWASSVAMTPLITYRRLADGGRARASEHWLYSLLHDRPNRWQTAFQYWEMAIQHLATRGAHIAWKRPGTARGEVAELIPLHPDRVNIRQEDNRALTFMYRERSGAELRFTQDEVLWIPYMSEDGVHPLSPLAAAARAIQMAITAEDYGQRYFDNDASSPIAILTNSNAHKTKEAKDEFREALIRQQSGANRHKPLVLSGVEKIEQLKVGNRDVQLMDLRSFQLRDIARVYGIQPHLIGDLERATFSNIEQQHIEFVTLTLMPLFVRIQQAVLRDLILDEDLFAEFLPDALLRGDTASRFSAYQQGIQSGWLSRNEARERENLNREDGLDTFLEPQNMRPAGEKTAPAASSSRGGPLPPPGRRGREKDNDEMEPENRAAARSTERKDHITARAVRKAVRVEIEGISKVLRAHGNDHGGFRAAAAGFYAKHADHLCAALHIGPVAAAMYCEANLRAAAESGAAALETFAQSAEPALLALIEENHDD